MGIFLRKVYVHFMGFGSGMEKLAMGKSTFYQLKTLRICVGLLACGGSTIFRKLSFWHQNLNWNPFDKNVRTKERNLQKSRGYFLLKFVLIFQTQI